MPTSPIVAPVDRITDSAGHNFAEHEFLPDQIKGTKLYEPGNNTRENNHREFLKKRWKGKYGY